jgi:O-antigen ligase
MYQQTILHTFENNILFGVAVKDRGFYFIPLGSHSTYLGALLKTGLLGVTSLILFSAYFWKRFFSEMFKENSSPISRSLSPLLLLMTLFWAFEDIDAAQFLSVIYFLIVGIYLKGDKG